MERKKKATSYHYWHYKNPGDDSRSGRQQIAKLKKPSDIVPIVSGDLLFDCDSIPYFRMPSAYIPKSHPLAALHDNTTTLKGARFDLEPILAHLERECFLTWDEQLEIMLHFSWMMSFSLISPFAILLSALAMALEKSLDVYKITHLKRRVYPASGPGSVDDCLGMYRLTIYWGIYCNLMMLVLPYAMLQNPFWLTEGTMGDGMILWLFQAPGETEPVRTHGSTIAVFIFGMQQAVFAVLWTSFVIIMSDPSPGRERKIMTSSTIKP